MFQDYILDIWEQTWYKEKKAQKQIRENTNSYIKYYTVHTGYLPLLLDTKTVLQMVEENCTLKTVK